MSRDDWPDETNGGFVKGELTYCCRGCSEDACTCKLAMTSGERAPDEDEIRRDAASGAFVQSLQHQTEKITPSDYGTDVTGKKPEQPNSGGLA